MCGIAGAQGDHPAEVAAMLDRIGHRGPDGRGVKSAHGFTSGHVRLAILDPDERSAQPWDEGGAVLCFNGELWNYEEVRGLLPGPWRTTSDTEVLARALLLHGVEWTMERIDGMFAFSWVTPERTVLAHDRFSDAVRKAFTTQNR